MHRDLSGWRITIKPTKSEYPAGTVSSDIEITSKMIEAALPALWDYDPDFANERDVVARIFRAMLTLSR